ncbi:MAG TPA: glycine cleavage system aminomethyltransferase GcvT [Alphaproteobacteria bacterium]|nr:glycine cleavage system aminomethyltransferase GcvT [Alphaproteobacteria bacterium]
MTSSSEHLLRTPLHRLHLELGGKMVPFAGYEMPVQYPAGVLKEHLHVRAAAGLFDVSHMGQIRLSGRDAAKALETLVPGNIEGLQRHRMRYTLFTNDTAGILDDLMVTHCGDHLFLVVNAACKQQDVAHLEKHLAGACRVEVLEDRALLALQGPQAAAVLARFAPAVADMRFMSAQDVTLRGVEAFVTRSGYTGEDGFEISLPADRAEEVARALLAEPEVEAIGLGARDSLRLEAGLCLYGHDIDKTSTPVEANLAWAIGRRRREEGGFPGHQVVLRQLEEGGDTLRVGLTPDGRAPAREGTEVTDMAGKPIGTVTSGGFGPTVGRPIAMGYVKRKFAADGTPVQLIVRGKPLPARVATMPFVPHRYHRG